MLTVVLQSIIFAGMNTNMNINCSRMKGETIAFKVDEALAKAMAGISNRSDFIRTAILSALGNSCPLCKGSGVLSASQRLHWEMFTGHHQLHTCSQCRESHIICEHEAGQE